MAVAQTSRQTDPAEDFLSRGGEMGARIRLFDWAKTPLGPLGNWPETLRASVATCLRFPFPMTVGWGPDLILLYNDACIPLLGAKHPHQALGQNYRACFAELSAGPSAGPLLLLEKSCHLIREPSGGTGGGHDALRGKEERCRTFFESIDEALCTIEVLFDPDDRPMDFRILETNPAFVRHTRLQDAAGRTGLELVPHLERRWIEMLGRIALTGEPVRTQNRVEAMNSWFDVYGFRFGPPENRRVGVVFTNITNRKEAEEALREGERQFRAVADLVPDLLWSNDPEGYTTWYNRQWLEYTGLTIEDARGFGWLDALHHEDRDASLVGFLQALHSEEPMRREQRIRRSDGAYRWFLTQARPVRDEAGHIQQWFGASTDIHDLRLAMEETRASLAEKEALLKEVHHRVNNNLQVITSLLNLQAQQVEDQQVLAQLEETRSRIQSIAMIHESLYRSGSLAAVDLAAYAQRLAEDLVRFYAAGDRVSLEISGGGKVLLPIERAVPCGLLLNELLSNALKHAYPVKPGGTIRVDVGAEEKHYTVEVGDNGIGLPADLDTRQAKSLGLQLVQVLARQIGGAVVMTSDRGGTRVQIRFPRVTGPDEEEE